MEDGARVLEDDRAGALLLAHDRGHAVHWLSHALFGAGRRYGPCLRSHGRALSVFWHLARLVGRSADRFGYRVECALWEPTKNFSRTNRSALHPDGGREQLWRRNGQDD